MIEKITNDIMTANNNLLELGKDNYTNNEVMEFYKSFMEDIKKYLTLTQKLLKFPHDNQPDNSLLINISDNIKKCSVALFLYN